jgi:hypothetical protein
MDSLKNENHLGVILSYPDPRQKETAPKCQAVLSQSEGDIDFMSCILDYVKDKGLGVANVTKLLLIESRIVPKGILIDTKSAYVTR